MPKTKAKPKRKKTASAKKVKRPATKARPKAGKLASDLREWRWVLAMLVVLILVILIWGKRFP